MTRTTTTELATQIRRAWGQMTQSQFAKKLGVRQQKLSAWENGKRLRAVLDDMYLLNAVGRS